MPAIPFGFTQCCEALAKLCHSIRLIYQELGIGIMDVSAIRFPICLLIGLITGGILGTVFIPDPTGYIALLFGTACTVLITWYLYQSDWLRKETNTSSA